MNFSLKVLFFQSVICTKTAASGRCNYGHLLLTLNKRRQFAAAAIHIAEKSEELLVVVGGGAAGVYGAIRAKTVAPNLNVVVLEKGKPLSKVKISGGGRCNVTNGHCPDTMSLVENYPRGHRELRGPFFNVHGPLDTMAWFTNRGVELKIEGDGRVFPVSNSSSSVIDCLLTESNQRGGMLSST
uniref:Oxidoreductase n=2 Tax=Rhizophora mucronata TaxID=61149 RepID=A0A2P2IPC8_RHIMU